MGTSNTVSHRVRLFDALRARADAPTLTGPDDAVLTGVDICSRARAIAGRWAEQGAGPGQRVLIRLPNGIDLALAHLACAWGGFVAVPADPEAPEAVLDAMRSATLPAFELGPGDLPADATGGPDLPVTGPGEDLLLITFTSGTTGAPKAMAHKAEALLGNAAAFMAHCGLGIETRMLNTMPMYYMAGILNALYCPLIAGGSVVLNPPFSPRTALGFWRRCEDEDVTAVWLSPTMLRVAMAVDRRPDDAPRYCPEHIFVGTAPLAPADGAAFRGRYGVPARQSYGLSELLLISIEDPEPASPGGVGRTLQDVQAVLAADDELIVTTPAAFAGYLDPATGALAPAPADFPTGDLASIGPDDAITITGRKKDIIVVGGINVAPVTVEHALATHDRVAEVAVTGEDDPMYGEKVVAWIVAVPGMDTDDLAKSLRSHADMTLPASARPGEYRFRDAMPAGPTGKIQKHLLT